MTESNLQYACAAAKWLTNLFTEERVMGWVPMDFWKTPTIAQELVNHMWLAGTDDYHSLVDCVRRCNSGYLDCCGYLDDATVWGRFHITAYDWLTAARPTNAIDEGHDLPKVYVDDAYTVFNGLITTWDSQCGGGLYWRRPGTGDDDANFKAVNSTLGLMEIGLGLYRIRGDVGALDWAKKAWDWIDRSGLLAKSGLLADDGMVWGGLTPDCRHDDNNKPVVALQGNPLTPLWWMYQATGDGALLDIAQRIAAGTIKTFVWPGTRTLQTEFDGEWAKQDGKWHEDHQNDAMFKGVFCGFLGPFTVNLASVPARREAAERYAAFLRANAQTLVSNFPTGIYPMDWHLPNTQYKGDDDDDQDRRIINNVTLQYSGLAALDAAAAVDAAVPGTA